MEKEFQEEYQRLPIPMGFLSKRFIEQLCYRFYLLGRKRTKTKKIKSKESL
jgi:hypothetical protein